MFKKMSNVTVCHSLSLSFMSSVKHPQKAKVLSSSPTGGEARCDCVCPSGRTSFPSRIIRLLVFVDTTLWMNIGNVCNRMNVHSNVSSKHIEPSSVDASNFLSNSCCWKKEKPPLDLNWEPHALWISTKSLLLLRVFQQMHF